MEGSYRGRGRGRGRGYRGRGRGRGSDKKREDKVFNTAAINIQPKILGIRPVTNEEQTHSPKKSSIESKENQEYSLQVSPKKRISISRKSPQPTQQPGEIQILQPSQISPSKMEWFNREESLKFMNENSEIRLENINRVNTWNTI